MKQSKEKYPEPSKGKWIQVSMGIETWWDILFEYDGMGRWFHSKPNNTNMWYRNELNNYRACKEAVKANRFLSLRVE